MTTSKQTSNVLFLCTGNSARSILSEAILNRLGSGRIRAFSAGSKPVGKVNPGALELLGRLAFPTEELRSKSWDEFSGTGAPPIDIVITVCDNAAGETCPLWNGAPVTAHWGVPDPAADGDFDAAYSRLRKRIEALVALPVEAMNPRELSEALAGIHR